MSAIDHFRPAWWLHNRHLQTIYPALWRRPQTLVRQRERLILADGDFIDLDWFGGDDPPLVILLHGLSGSSQSGYIVGLQYALRENGFASVAMNFRGCSGEPNRLARCYHSGETEDIDFVYRSLRQRYPQRKMAAVGFSLGGNVLLKWLGEQGQKLDLFAAVAVSVPLVLSECATKLDHGFSKIYRDRLLTELKQYIADKIRYLERLGVCAEVDKLRHLGDLSAIRSFWEYDDRVVARLHGFADVQDYYRRSSSRQFLSAVRVPTLLIQAADDPFMTPNVLPKSHELGQDVTLALQSAGGHVGFIGSRRGLKPDYWLDRRIPAFLSQCLRSKSSNNT